MGKSCFLRNSNVKKLLGLVEMTTGLVNASFSLPDKQAVNMIFFAPCLADIVVISIQPLGCISIYSINYLS